MDVPAHGSSVIDRAAELAGWPLHPKERGDLYHRVRAFPPEIARWREEIVASLRSGDRRLPGVARAPRDLELLREQFGEGVSHLREIARILTLIYKYPSLQNKREEPHRFDARSLRVLSRLGPYRKLGLALHGLDSKELRTVLADLVPPNLRRSLRVNLARHARDVCRGRNPDCGGCELRRFCGYYRRQSAESAAESDAPSIVDLFCGAGGLSLGFRRAGFRTKLALDSDPAAIRTYSVNHPEVPDASVLCIDIRDVDPIEIRRKIGRRRIDVLIGAPPCQGFSHVGFRSKLTRTGYQLGSDHRNYLFEWMIAAAVVLKPRYFLLENVPGMQSARKQNLSYLETAAKQLEQKAGFATDIWRLNASAYGVPQDRIRYFLVGSSTGTLPSRPRADYQDRQSRDLDVDALDPVALGEALFDLPERDPSSGSGVTLREPPDPSSDRRFRRYLKKFGLVNGSRLIFNHSVRYHNKRDLELYALLEPGEDSVHALERYGRDDLMRYRADVFDDKYARLREDRPSKTIVAHLAKDGNGYIHPTQVRSISIREAARLQSFPDDYVFCGAPSDQWIQIGNAVPPIMAEAVARRFFSLLRS